LERELLDKAIMAQEEQTITMMLSLITKVEVVEALAVLA
jgi:hypothetical protein